MNPGTTHFPSSGTIVAPFGMATSSAGPIAAMCDPFTTITASRISGAPVPSKTSAPV